MRYLLNAEAPGLKLGVEARVEAGCFHHLPHTAKWPARPGPLSQEPLFTRPDSQLKGDVMESSPESLLRPIFFLPFQEFCFFLRSRHQRLTHPQLAETVSKTLPIADLTLNLGTSQMIIHSFIHVLGHSFRDHCQTGISMPKLCRS